MAKVFALSSFILLLIVALFCARVRRRGGPPKLGAKTQLSGSAIGSRFAVFEQDRPFGRDWGKPQPGGKPIERGKSKRTKPFQRGEAATPFSPVGESAKKISPLRRPALCQKTSLEWVLRDAKLGRPFFSFQLRVRQRGGHLFLGVLDGKVFRRQQRCDYTAPLRGWTLWRVSGERSWH
jgi:hypothetical protein